MNSSTKLNWFICGLLWW